MRQVPIVPFHRLNFPQRCCPASQTSDIAAQAVRPADPLWPFVSAHVALRHTLSIRPLLQLITDINDSSPCKAFTEEHVKSRPFVLPPSFLFCNAASLHPIKAKRSSVGKLKIRVACSIFS